MRLSFFGDTEFLINGFLLWKTRPEYVAHAEVIDKPLIKVGKTKKRSYDEQFA